MELVTVWGAGGTEISVAYLGQHQTYNPQIQMDNDRPVKSVKLFDICKETLLLIHLEEVTRLDIFNSNFAIY